MTLNWKDQNVLITGGTGSFGKKFVDAAIDCGIKRAELADKLKLQ